MKNCKPFVKWVGGKTQLVKNIEASLPLGFLSQREVTYIEPFVGGGAMLFWLLKNFPNIKKAVINDINPDLTGAYRMVKEHPYELIDFLSGIESVYYELGDEVKQKEFFLAQRDRYNYDSLSCVEKAGLFIFLNRTCFNGLYRVNKKGYFNVPFGRYKNPKICDRDTIIADSELLQRVEILTGDFSQTVEYAAEDSFFYFDPPYKPLSKTSNFTTYAKEDFGDADQLRLADFCKEINNKGSRFVLSNSDLKNTNPKDNFFDDIYSVFSIERVYASRMINSKSDMRGKITEILVSNLKQCTYEYKGAF